MELFTKILPSLPLWFLIVMSSAGTIVADYFAKVWSINTKTIFLVLAFLGYFVSSFFYIPALLKEGLVITSLMWSLLSTAGFLIIGLVIFRESLNTWQIVGVVLGLISLIILSVAEYI